ncbi:MAG: L-seryl-tRNA(Sec) selenium transferase [Chloroflexota bacterium]
MSAARPPSIERLLAATRPRIPAGTDPAALADAARELVAEERRAIAGGAPARDVAGLAVALAERLAHWADPGRSGLVPVLNATGVLLHTNLGRAAWPPAAIEAAARTAASPVLLELDRESGRRGPRSRIAEEHLVALTGAEDALITVNNAAALALAVGLAGRRGVAVSRGELVEIGGGVRIPEIIRRAGARLVEVGTTNRTRAADFAEPLAAGRAHVVLRVHPSNFRQSGFTETPDPAELAALAHAHGAIVIDDVGSGAFIDTAGFGLAHEPTPRERLAAGADLVTFSGDKLVGGPQAGPIAGRADLIARLRRDPLARAVRPDKVTLAALAATLGLWRAGRGVAEIPVWRAIAAPRDALAARATTLAAALVADGIAASVRETRATVGGGSLPGETLPSAAVALAGPGMTALAARLRAGEPAVVARVEDGALLADLRAIDPADDARLLAALRAAARR